MSQSGQFSPEHSAPFLLPLATGALTAAHEKTYLCHWRQAFIPCHRAIGRSIASCVTALNRAFVHTVCTSLA